MASPFACLVAVPGAKGVKKNDAHPKFVPAVRARARRGRFRAGALRRAA